MAHRRKLTNRRKEVTFDKEGRWYLPDNTGLDNIFSGENLKAHDKAQTAKRRAAIREESAIILALFQDDILDLIYKLPEQIKAKDINEALENVIRTWEV